MTFNYEELKIHVWTNIQSSKEPKEVRNIKQNAKLQLTLQKLIPNETIACCGETSKRVMP